MVHTGDVVRLDGWAGPVEVRVPGGAQRLEWRGAAPNPFAERVTLGLEVPRAGTGSVRVYDVTGHEVARLVSGPIGAGRLGLQWDGRGRLGRALSAGVYLVVARIGGETAVRRVMRMP